MVLDAIFFTVLAKMIDTLAVKKISKEVGDQVDSHRL